MILSEESKEQEILTDSSKIIWQVEPINKESQKRRLSKRNKQAEFAEVEDLTTPRENLNLKKQKNSE